MSKQNVFRVVRWYRTFVTCLNKYLVENVKHVGHNIILGGIWMTMEELHEWESHFKNVLQHVGIPERENAGALLSVIPCHEEWNDFISVTEREWDFWYKNLIEYPRCLVVLYGGLAFYRYDSNTFWPYFSESIGYKSLNTNQQREINVAFSKASNNLGFRLLTQKGGTSYVGSAVYHIGIPLSIWDDFLEVCEWASWQDNWGSLTDGEWNKSVTKLAGTRTRLKNFLVENRESTTHFIQEMLSARKQLAGNPSLTIDDLAQASYLRCEYFDEVPETADFLRPLNPESLLRDRVQIVLDEHQDRVSLLLPAVPRDELPATWCVGELHQEASATPDEMALNFVAFQTTISLKIKSKHQDRLYNLRGIKHWGLFDLEKRGLMINPNRKQFPVSGYAILSLNKIEKIHRNGFEEDDYPANEEYELEDGTVCYVTQLWPKSLKSTKVSFTYEGMTKVLRFRSDLKAKVRLFIGGGRHASYFRYYQNEIITGRFPLICVAIPLEYAENMENILKSKFQIHIDNIPVQGIWKKIHKDEDMEFVSWIRDPSLKLSDLERKRRISIEALEFGVKSEYKIRLDKPNYKIDKCWKKLPGAFIPWFLLCQPSDDSHRTGMKWGDLILANAAIEPKQRLSYDLFNKYKECGLIERNGRFWRIAESRVVFDSSENDGCHMKFCGDPSVLWGLYRRIHGLYHDLKLPAIEVVNKKNEMPFLFVRWKNVDETDLRKYLERHNVHIVSDLWRV